MSLEIINCARGYLRVPLIGSLSEGSEAAKQSAVEYKKALRWFIAQSEWQCQTIAECPEKLADPDCCDLPNGFRHAFFYPERAMRLASVCLKSCPGKCECEPIEDVHWRIIKIKTSGQLRKVIIADCEPIKIEYVCYPDDCDVEAMPQDFQDAITYRLAQHFALANGDPAQANNFFAMARNALSSAKSFNARHSGDRDDELSAGFLIEGRQW